ncbi:Fe-S cluster assembly protein SufB [Candidatus Woesearchaeota archaeon]|nr:Fe-S cluster assembly protein SufB [Candidatus Woesearchaeota archaeon]
MVDQDFVIDRSRYDDANTDTSVFKAPAGLTKETVMEISKQKKEPDWMLQKRLAAFEHFEKTPLPTWGPSLSKLDLNKITYFVRPGAKESKRWEDVPEAIRKTAERIGIPEAEKRALSGVGYQYDSDVVYHNIKKEWEEQGVIFENMDVAVHKYPELVRKYFMTSCVPINDHKFVMLHGAVWSGGTFIYVPPGVKVTIPLQAYFRMNAQNGGQFEHTLIIADKGSEVHYIEGCSAPRFEASALHAGCVEIHVLEDAKVRYSSVENWSKNTYNLNTKRAVVDKNGVIEWINGNLGCLTEGAQVFTNPKGPISIKNIDVGSKIYVWDHTTNRIVKSMVKGKVFSGKKPTYRLEAGGREIEATANHPFLTLTHQKRQPHHKKAFFQHEWKSLSYLKEGDLVAIAKQLPIEGQPFKLPPIEHTHNVNSRNQYGTFTMNTKHLFNENITLLKETTEDFMWLMGLLLGDGHIDTKHNKINIAIPEQESLQETVIDVVYKLFNYSITYKKDRYVIINSKLLAMLFSQIGFGGTANTKRIPNWVFTLPKTHIQALIAGYFDSDGHAHKNALAFTSINKPLLNDLRLLATTVGFGVSQIFSHGKKRKTTILGVDCNAQDSWRIHLNGPLVHSFPSRSHEKQEKIKLIKTKRNYISADGLNFKSKTNEYIGFATITKIAPLGEQPTYDIEVENYHNFISNGLIVHNSGCTMLYPCSILRGEGAHADSLGIAFAGPGQHQDTGSKVIHAAPYTTSAIRAKSISKGGGISSYRGYLRTTRGAQETKSTVVCDALLIDDTSTSNTYPFMKIENNDVDISHEATVGKIGDEEIFYLMSRGLTEDQALKMIVAGFIEPVVKQLPLEYAVELNKLIELEMEDNVG